MKGLDNKEGKVFRPSILEMISFFSSEIEHDQEDLAYKLFSVYNDNQLSGYFGNDDMSWSIFHLFSVFLQQKVFSLLKPSILFEIIAWN